MARKRRGTPIHGWLNIDKDAGLSSAQVVGRIKRITNAQKVGHAGTLDPFATGILPIALNKACKESAQMMDLKKKYSFEVKWGQQTDSDDQEGKIIKTCPKRPTKSEILSVIWQFCGH